MKMSQISPTQLAALELLEEYKGLDEFRAAILIGERRLQVLRALESRGYARYFPTSEKWKITREGRTDLKKFWQEIVVDMDKKFPIGTPVLVYGCHVQHECSENSGRDCAETEVPAEVVKHGRDSGGVYTLVRFADGREEAWHRAALRADDRGPK